MQHLKRRQTQLPLRSDVIPPALANSFQWIVWSYEVAGRKNSKFGIDKVPYQARDPWIKTSRWDISGWTDLETALQCLSDNPHVDGIGYFFSENDGLIGIDFDNCRDPETEEIIRKEYEFWIDKLDGYTEVSPSGTGIKVWVKGSIDSRYFRNDESTGFRIPNFAGGVIEIYRRGQYFAVTTQVLDGFEHIKPAQEELDVLSEFYFACSHNTLSEGLKSGDLGFNIVGVLPKGAKASLGKNTINDIQFSQDGTRLAVATGIGIGIYDAETGKELFLLSPHTGKVISVVFCLNRHQLVSGTEDGTICIWDVTTGTHSKKHTMNDVRDVIFSPDRSTIATLSWEKIRFWNIATGNLHQTLTANIGRDFLTAVLSPDGCTLAISEDGTYTLGENCPINLWNITTRKRIKTLTTVWEGTSSMAFSPDGSTFANDAGILANYSIHLWDIATGERLKTFTGHETNVHSLTFSPDGDRLAAGCEDSSIHLWDISTGEHIKKIIGHSAGISSLCFSPDGNTLASGCQDGTVLLWDIDSTNDETALTDDNPFIVPTIEEIRDNPFFDEPPDIFDIDSNNNETVLKEKDTEFQNRASHIQQFCEDRGITTLCHFTRVENLQSILQEGLIGRGLLEEQRQQFLFNDNDRVDGHKEAVCLSISFPNYQMFYSIRERKKSSEGVDHSQWIVLLLDATMLWELECAFCQRNAAHKTVSSIPLKDRRKPEALKGMFEDFYNIRHQNLSIPQDYPTHPQAEVLVFDPIPVRYIKAIHFWDAASQESWLPSNTDGDYEASGTDRHYFEPRCDYEDWKPTNFNNKGIPLSYTAENNIDGISLQPQKTPAQTPVPDHPLVEDIDLGIDPNDPFADPDDEDDIPF